MARTLELMADTGKRILVDRNTHIGSLQGINSEKMGLVPSSFGPLEMAVVVDHPWVSQGHAVILKHGEDFVLGDLDSHNGTYHARDGNIERIMRPNYFRLEEGDGFNLAGKVAFSVKKIWEHGAGDNHALLVGHDGGNLRGVTTDLDMVKKELKGRGYNGNIRVLLNRDATWRNIQRYLMDISSGATDDSGFIFYYSGHGSKNDLAMRGRVSPDMLYNEFRRVRGKKTVILDSCHAGRFVLPEPGVLVVAATPEGQKAYEQMTKFAGYNAMGVMTSALLKYFAAHPHRFDLGTGLRDHFKSALTVNHYKMRYQQPVVGGGSFMVYSQVYRDHE